MKILVHMIRHGLTQGNVDDWIYGGSDVPLIDEGREQIREFIEKDIYPRPETKYYFTTGLSRTEETLRMIYGEKEHRQIPELQEMHFGVYEKTPIRDVMDKPEFKRWAADKSGDAAPEGGESLNQFKARILGGIDKLVDIVGSEVARNERVVDAEETEGDRKADAEAIIVAHGGVISGILSDKFKKEDQDHIYQWLPDPGRGFTLIFEEGELTDFTKI